MARRAALTASALLVLGGHAALLDWLAGHLAAAPPLRLMPEPMFTRLITVQAPAPAPRPPPRPRPAAPLAPVEAVASVKASTPESATPTLAQAPVAPPPEAPAPAPATVAIAPPPAAIAPPAPVQPPAPPAPAADPLAGWPTDTRLSYTLTGWFRGELYGDARVQWQRSGERYQVRVDVDVGPFVSLAMTSQGQVTPQGLRPAVYEETRRGRTRSARMDAGEVTLDGGRRVPRPDGLQDTASQFVELAWRFGQQLQPLHAGGQVSFWMARPGAVDLWTYDVVERAFLQTPKLGVVEAFHLKPRPIAHPRGNITAEMWFAPGLQYLPVRIRINQGNEAHLDLLVEQIEQK